MFAIVRHSAVHRIHLGLIAMFEILQHACPEQFMLFNYNRNNEQRLHLGDFVLVIDQFYDILTLNGLDFDPQCLGDLNALLDDAKDALARLFVVRSVAEVATHYSGHAAEGGVDDQFCPTRAGEIIHNDRFAHDAEQALDFVHFRVWLAGHGADVIRSAHRVPMSVPKHPGLCKWRPKQWCSRLPGRHR